MRAPECYLVYIAKPKECFLLPKQSNGKLYPSLINRKSSKAISKPFPNKTQNPIGGDCQSDRRGVFPHVGALSQQVSGDICDKHDQPGPDDYTRVDPPGLAVVAAGPGRSPTLDGHPGMRLGRGPRVSRGVTGSGEGSDLPADAALVSPRMNRARPRVAGPLILLET